MYRKIFLIMLGVLLVLPLKQLQAEEPKLPAESIELSNQIILWVYQDILDQKLNYPELSGFGEKSLYKNAQGIYTLIYDYAGEKKQDDYSFGLTINTLDAIDFKERTGRFNYGFPKLNLKISGFLNKHPIRTQYDIMPLIGKYGMVLAEYQQKFMPLRIFIAPAKDTFKVKEKIEFDVVLQNVSKRHMRVKTLSQDSLYFVINNKTWGTNPVGHLPTGSEEVLLSGQTTKVRMVGESFLTPQKLKITCFYGMSIEGINPMGKMTINIEE